MNRTVLESIVGVTVVVSATVTAHWGVISGDALVGIYSSVLGYVFGRAHTQLERNIASNGNEND